jgi:hypothetical protein
VPRHAWTRSSHVVVGVEFTGLKPASASTIAGLVGLTLAADQGQRLPPESTCQKHGFACISIVTNIYIASGLGVC